MKLLVFSDSHGRKELVDRMLSKESACKEIIFLGDGAKEVDWIENFYPEKHFTCVRGNNDWYSQLNGEAYKYFDGITIFACHGDYYNVRTTLSALCKKAASVNAPLALYGHTHVPKVTKDPSTGVTAVNPGALCDGKYCVIEISKGSFNVEHKSCYQEAEI